jgi:ATP-dependent Clp protease ATP-binding subunit ClpA
MFERWTDNFRRVLRRARQPGRRPLRELSGVDLLRGLLDPPDSLATRLLQAAEVDLAELRAALVPPTGSDAPQVIEQAAAESRRRGDHWVGTEHLLLAAARRSGGQAGELLAARGASAERLEQLLAALAEERRTHPPLARRLGTACRVAFDWLRRRA